MDIQHHDGKRGRFFIEQDGERLAELLYFHSRPDKINIFHTEVKEKLAGQGIGKQLVAAAAAYARAQGLKITATCPYAAKVLAKTAEYEDVFEK